MSLFWKRKQSDETGKEAQQEVAPKNRHERTKENAQSWLNLDINVDGEDEKQQSPQLFRDGTIGSLDPSEASQHQLDKLDPDYFSLEAGSKLTTKAKDAKSIDRNSEEHSQSIQPNKAHDSSLYDLDRQLFKNAADDTVDEQSSAKVSHGDEKQKNSDSLNTNSRVLAFKSVKPTRKIVQANIKPSQKAVAKHADVSKSQQNAAQQVKEATPQQSAPRIVTKPSQKLSLKTQSSSAGNASNTTSLNKVVKAADEGSENTSNDKRSVDAVSAVQNTSLKRDRSDPVTSQTPNTKNKDPEPKRIKVTPKVSLNASKQTTRESELVSKQETPVASSNKTVVTKTLDEQNADSINSQQVVPKSDDLHEASLSVRNKENVLASENSTSEKIDAGISNEESLNGSAGDENVHSASDENSQTREEKEGGQEGSQSQEASLKDDEIGVETVKGSSKWHKHLEKLETVDPLVDCLVSLSKHFDNPYTADGIRAGLPISDQGMTPELFMRAAKRIGFVTRFVKRPLQKIADVLLPVVLLLENNQACVLIEIDSEHEKAKVFLPESGEGEVYLPISQLLDMYTGYCFFVRPQFRFDKRSMSSAEQQLNGKHWFWGTLTSSWRIYRDVIIASLLINLFAIASPLFVMNVYDRVVPNNAFDTLWVLAIGATVVYGFDFLLRSLRSYFIDVAGKKSDILMSATIFAKVNNITMASRPRSVGAFAKNLQDFESIRDFITSASVTTLVDIPFMFLIVGMIYLIGGPVGYIPIVTIILVLIYSLIIQRPLKRSIEEGQKTSMQKNAVLIESLANAESVKLNNAQGTLQQQWEQAVGNISDWGLKTRQLAQSSSSFAMVAQQMTTVGMVVVGVYMISEREMSMGALVACVMLTGRALGPMSQFASLAARYNHAKSAYNGLKDIMASPVEQPDELKFVHRPRFDGSFEFDGVSFAYPEQDQDAISNINLHINAGEKVAIIGRIGSGKSTLGKLMMGLYAPKTGALRADGIDMRQINPVDLRRNVGAVSQDVSLFYGSIKDNICFGVPFIEDEAIIRAADISGVSEFANRRPSGLDSIVGERGQNLSGGQRQSVAIARALLFDPNILVLDEPTASMDNTTEARMRKRLVDVVKDKTLILITHKSSMLDLVDRVVVMDNGRILADGPKAHVLEALRQGKLKVS
ncbi:type I secretion system permease/ATPase [Marinomonas communis]|uniref:type I secretion system permease/ATPase n=1 Tax=Marinomonas communis TaxID=28254 RepID=UPI002B1CB0BD|nr:type I secretion system permease/ATPase [Marinomonas communis]